jgi:hypothetical protein
MLAWWIEVGGAILGASIVLTLTIDRLVLARREDGRRGDRMALPEDALGRARDVVSRIPRDVFSIAFIVLVVIAGFLGVRHALVGVTKSIPIRTGTAVVDATAPSKPRAGIPKLPGSPLPKDFSVNRPPWCPACNRPSSPRPAAQ